jgi:SAM-dependent methyltransferase
MDNFINIPFTKENLDRYYIRTSILNALNETLPKLKGNLLDIGCGKMPYKNYIIENSKTVNYVGLDIENALEYDSKIKPNFTWDGKTIPFENNTFECAIGTEVLEHCPNPEIVLKEVLRVLKPGGCFFFTVPFLWNLHEVPNDEYRYTPFSLERHLIYSGFNNIEINATGGWHASLAQMLGLWVRRSPLPKSKRKLLSLILKPIIKYLLKIDKIEQITFKEGQMITGIYGVARK